MLLKSSDELKRNIFQEYSQEFNWTLLFHRKFAERMTSNVIEFVYNWLNGMAHMINFIRPAIVTDSNSIMQSLPISRHSNGLKEQQIFAGAATVLRLKEKSTIDSASEQ